MFIKLPSKTQYSPQYTIRLILIIATSISLVVLTLLVVGMLIGQTYLLQSTIITMSIVLYLAFTIYCFKKGYVRTTHWLLMSLFTALAIIIILTFTVKAAIGVLLLGFSIVLSGVIFGARSVIPIGLAVIALIFILQTVNIFSYTARSIPLAIDAVLAETISYSAIIAILSIVCWLSRRQIEESLREALVAEAALKKEKALLSTRLAARTRSLRKAQYQEMQQLYKFAEIGQMTTALLHELANSLTILTLDIDDLQQRHESSETLARTQTSIRSIDKLVSQVRRRINENVKNERIDAIPVIKETITSLKPKAKKHKLSLILSKDTTIKTAIIVGDSLRLSQCLTILINNAIDANISTDKTGQQKIIIHIERLTNQFKVSVIDFGVGIPPKVRQRLFEPVQSSKQDGLGIGLFIAKQIMVTHFKGELHIDPRKDQTQFYILLPIKEKAPVKEASS